MPGTLRTARVQRGRVVLRRRRPDNRGAMGLPSARHIVSAAVLTVFAGCQTAAPGAPTGPHAIGHAAGTCELCDLYTQAQTWVVRIRTPSSLGTPARNAQRWIELHGGRFVPSPFVEEPEGLTPAVR